jgi:hypothetical protein
MFDPETAIEHSQLPNPHKTSCQLKYYFSVNYVNGFQDDAKQP